MSRSGRVVVALGAPVLVVLVAACGGDAPSSGLPTIGASSSGGAGSLTPTVTPSSRWTPEQQQVLDRIDEYYAVAEAMAAGKPLDMAQLKSVASDAWAQKLGENLQVLKASKQVITPSSGGTKRTPMSVEVTGASAREVHCVDQSGTVITTKGKPEPSKASDYKPTPLDVTLQRLDGLWKVAGVVVAEDITC